MVPGRATQGAARWKSRPSGNGDIYIVHVPVFQGFKVSEPADTLLPKVRAAFAACVRLIRFYRQNRENLDKAASESVPPL
jgi:hypothetical protein